MSCSLRVGSHFGGQSRTPVHPAQVLAQLKRFPADDNPGAAGLEVDMLCRLLKENPVLKRIEVSCRPRLTGSITLKRYGAGEVRGLQEGHQRPPLGAAP